MLGEVFRAIILSDDSSKDRTAADVMAANPGVFIDEDLVPLDSYLSVQTLLLGAGSEPEKFENAVSKSFGTNTSPARYSINIAIEEMDSYEDPKGAKINTSKGKALSAYVRILVRLHSPVIEDDANKVELIQWRICSLLDAEARHRTGRVPVLPTDGHPVYDLDASMENGLPLHCNFVRFGGSPENVIERVSWYSCPGFIRRFFRAS